MKYKRENTMLRKFRDSTRTRGKVRSKIHYPNSPLYQMHRAVSLHLAPENRGELKMSGRISPEQI